MIVRMKTALAWFAIVSLWGCAATLPAPAYTLPTDPYAALIDAAPHGIAPDDDMLALPPEADALLADVLKGANTPLQKMNAIGSLFGPVGGLGLRYEALESGTAEETLKTRVGSCLSFTSLYIALARKAGLDARYREVASATQWDMVGDYVLLNRHVVAYGEIANFGTYTMDFGLVDPSEWTVGHVISDARARAQHFNNLGARALTDGDALGAVRLLTRALAIDSSLGYVWSNLGTAYMHLSEPIRAEAALRHAADLVPYDVTPLNQLARLFEVQGKPELAQLYLDRAGAARLRNPYVLFQRGIEARSSGSLNVAIAYMERAIRTQPDDVHLLIELAQTYRMAGRLDRAKATLLEASTQVTTVDEMEALLDALGMKRDERAPAPQT
jgi:Flp pilus assembly protein TadD